MLNAPFHIVMSVTDDMWWYEPLKCSVSTNHTCHWYHYVIRSCVICHGGSHASRACLNGNLHTKFIVFKWSLPHDHYSLTWPTSVFVRNCGLNLAGAVIQRSMSHFGRCRLCHPGALLFWSSTAAHLMFGHLWISFTGVRSLGCGDLSFVIGCRRHRVTHSCVHNLTITGPYNGLSPGRRQAIFWTNAGILLIASLGTNFSEILIEIHTFSF